MFKDQSVLGRRFTRRLLPPVALSYRQLKLAGEVSAKLERGELTLTPLACLCGAVSDAVLATSDRFGVPSRAVLCLDCGLIRTDPRLSDDALSTFYSEHYQALNHGDESFDDLFEAQRGHGKLIVEHTGFSRRSRSLVLEIGTGPGGILAAFREAGHDVIGAEIDAKAVDWAKAKHDLSLRAGGVEALGDLTARADLVILSHVVEHLAHPGDVLESAAALLSPTGLLYVEVPGVKSLATGQAGMCGGAEPHPHRKDLLEYLRATHLWSFELDTLRALAASHGFELVSGDELVRGVFRRATGGAGARFDWGQDRGEETLAYLRGLERERRAFDRRHFAGNAWFWLRTFVSWGLRATKLRAP